MNIMFIHLHFIVFIIEKIKKISNAYHLTNPFCHLTMITNWWINLKNLSFMRYILYRISNGIVTYTVRFIFYKMILTYFLTSNTINELSILYILFLYFRNVKEDCTFV